MNSKTSNASRLQDALVRWRAAERQWAAVILNSAHPNEIAARAKSSACALQDVRLIVDSEPWAIMSKPKTPNHVCSSDLVSLRRMWKKRIEDLNNSKYWAVKDRACKEARASKADGIQECIIEINYLLKHGRAG